MPIYQNRIKFPNVYQFLPQMSLREYYLKGIVAMISVSLNLPVLQSCFQECFQDSTLCSIFFAFHQFTNHSEHIMLDCEGNDCWNVIVSRRYIKNS